MGQVILVVLLTVTVLTGCAAIAVAPHKVRTRPSPHENVVLRRQIPGQVRYQAVDRSGSQPSVRYSPGAA
jgi:hypothetical protein